MSLRDRALLARLRERDEEAFGQVVREHEKKVFALLYRMIGQREEAEDLAQEVFVTLFKSIDQFRGESKLSTWLYRIAVNHCKNRMGYLARRRAGTLQADGAEEKAPEGRAQPTHDLSAPDRLLEGKQVERMVQQAIAQLDEEHRLVLVLRDIQELSYEEVSEITGLPDGTVKSRLHRARMRIKELLSSDPMIRRRG